MLFIKIEIENELLEGGYYVEKVLIGSYKYEIFMNNNICLRLIDENNWNKIPLCSEEELL